MRIDEVLTQEADIKEWEALCKEKTSKALCKDQSRSDASLGKSNLDSCIGQGLRARNTGKVVRIGRDMVALDGKKIKSKKYGGPVKPNT